MSKGKLTKGWRLSSLKELFNLYYGKGLPTSELTDEGFNVYGANGIIGKFNQFLFENPMLIISCRGAASGAIHKTTPRSFVTSNSIILDIISHENIDLDYAKYSMIHADKSSVITGTAQPQITIQLLQNLKLPIAPLPEQQRIVAKLDAVFGHLDRVREKLDRIPVLLKNFRQQVLTQAVTGELTREWREGKGLPKQKAKEIRNKDYRLDDIPNEWVHTIIGTIASVKGGKRLPKEDALTEEITNHPYIRARDLKKGTVLTENLLYITEDVYKKISRYIVNQGDVYITIVGAKIGDAGIIPESMDGANLTENAAKLTDMQNVIPAYLSIWLRSPICQSFIQKTIMSAAQGKLALTRIKSLPIYLPHLVEQEKIVSTVESLFSLADKIESQYQSLKAKIDQMPQAILAKAFRGELVGQEVKEYVREIGELGMVAEED